MRKKSSAQPAIPIGATSALATFLLLGSALCEEDFIRGDVNGDGVVSMADAHFLLSYLQGWGQVPTCLNAADVNDSGRVDLDDFIMLKEFPVGLTDPFLPEPYPSVGRDPTPNSDPELSCAAYGGGEPLEDAAARIEILDAFSSDVVTELPGIGSIAPGTAIISLALTSSAPVAGFAGKIRVGDLFGYRSGGWLFDELATLTQSYFNTTVRDGELSFGNLINTFGPSAIRVRNPAGEHRPAFWMAMSLRAGVKAGEYPLTLEAGELVDDDSGRRIVPALGGGTLRVLSDVGPNVFYSLGSATCPRGGEATVPFILKADLVAQGYSVSLDFDEESLQVIALENLFRNPDGSRTAFEVFKFNNENFTPGNAGVDEGFIGGAVVASWQQPDQIPADQENTMMAIHFRVRPEAPAAVTDFRFLDGARPLGGPEFTNILTIKESSYTPETADSFVFVNGLIEIIPDGMPFRRGDANLDRAIDISDAQHILGYLFLGSAILRCDDAADSNDDGRIDIGDPIAILSYLFLGSRDLPPPLVAPGQDPTADSLDCRGGGS